MAKDQLREQFFGLFNLSLAGKMRATSTWENMQESLACNFLFGEELVNFPTLICGLSRKHRVREDVNGNSMSIEIPDEILRLQNVPPTVTTIVPDNEGHLRGCIQNTDYYGHATDNEPTYFGLTNNSFFYTTPHEGCGHVATYVNLNKPKEFYSFAQGGPEYNQIIAPTIAEIKDSMQTFDLGATTTNLEQNC